MAYQGRFWKGQIERNVGASGDKIRPNPEAPPMHGGPGEFDGMNGASEVKLGSSQPRSKGNPASDEFPLRHANVQPRRHSRMHQVLMAHALRMHLGGGGKADDGTTMGTAIGGGAAGGGAG